MTPKAITRLAIYGLAIAAGGAVAVAAQVQGDSLAVGVALAWIGTTALAALNVPRGSDEAEHAEV